MQPSASSCFESPVSNTKGNYSAASTWKPTATVSGVPLIGIQNSGALISPWRKSVIFCSSSIQKGGTWLKKEKKKKWQDRRQRAFWLGFQCQHHWSCHGRGGTKKRRHFTNTRPSPCVTRKIIKTTERTNLWLLRKLTLRRKWLSKRTKAKCYVYQTSKLNTQECLLM